MDYPNTPTSIFVYSVHYPRYKLPEPVEQHDANGETTTMRPPKPLWNPYAAGVLLGLGLLLTFLVTGNGYGATGATTRFTAQLSGLLAPSSVADGRYLHSAYAAGLNAWIVWEVLGLCAGALLGSVLAGRFKPQLDGPRRLGRSGRLLLPLLGGAAAGLGARLALGCTSGMGLSGAATLSAAGFLFLIGFFAAGLAFGQLTKGLWK